MTKERERLEREYLDIDINKAKKTLKNAKGKLEGYSETEIDNGFVLLEKKAGKIDEATEIFMNRINKIDSVDSGKVDQLLQEMGAQEKEKLIGTVIGNTDQQVEKLLEDINSEYLEEILPKVPKRTLKRKRGGSRKSKKLRKKEK